MKEIKITIPDYHIIPKARPKVTAKGTYMPEKYMDCKKVIATYGLKACRYDDMLEGYLGMDIIFYRKGGGDIDNLAGTIMDSLEGIVYGNDCKIKKLRVSVTPSASEDTLIRVYKLKKKWFERVIIWWRSKNFEA